jgi:hypothetical protein
MITQKLEINRRAATGKMKGCYDFVEHYISYLYYKETEVPLTILYGIKWMCEGCFQATDRYGA